MADVNKRNPVTTVLNGHAAVIASVGIFLFVGAKVWIIAHGNATTFKALLVNAGPAQVTLGTLTTSAPVAIVGLITVWLITEMTPPYVFDTGRRWRLDGWQLVTLNAGALVVAAVFLSAIFVFLTLVVFFVYAMMMLARRELTEARAELTRLSARSPILILLWGMRAVMGIAVLFLLASDEPWLPVEIIKVENGDSHVGYVIADGNDELVVLLEDDRLVTRLHVDDVEDREYCKFPRVDPSVAQEDPSKGGFVDELMFNSLLWGDDGYDSCP